MKRFILTMFSAGYDNEGAYAPTIRNIKTDDVAGLVERLALVHDIGVGTTEDENEVEIVDRESLDNAVKTLTETGHYDIGDGAWALTLIDLEKVMEEYNT